MMKSCWHSEPSARPTFDELDKRFKTMDITGVFTLEKRKRDLMKDTNKDALLFQVCMCACVHVCHKDTNNDSYQDLYIHNYTYTYTFKLAGVHACIQIIPAYVCTIYQISAHIHTYIHTYIHTRRSSPKALHRPSCMAKR